MNKMEIFCLSDKRDTSDNVSEAFYWEEDVKEFIRLLKDNEDIIDEIKNWMNDYKNNSDEREYPSYLSIVLKVIEILELKVNKLAGEKLI